MKINCIVIDDEPLARKGLKEYIADVDFLNLIGEFDSPLKAAEIISNGNIQLLFLDIQMPKITGLDFLKSLHQPPPVIFSTAYSQYALEGFEVNALDYLVKPVSFERFLKAAMKAKEFYEVREKNTGDRNKSSYFFIKADTKLVKIEFNDLLYVEALQNYVLIHTTDKNYMTYLTLKSVEDYLPKDNFLKIHKSYIVSVDKINSIEGNGLLIGKQHIPISRNQKDIVIEKLLNNKLLKR